MTWTVRARLFCLTVGLALTVGIFAVLYAQLPWWVDGVRLRHLTPQEQTAVLSGDRGDVLKMAAGAGALIALVYTARKHALDRQMFAMSEQGQVTDRYSTAIAQLASDKLEERIGGIYALERIMADSERDHPTVVEVLAAFVREHAPRPEVPARSSSNPAGPSTGTARPRADVHAAVTVLARRPDRLEPFSVDLRRASLTGLELPENTRLAGADLTGTDLSRVWFRGADLTSADLDEVTAIDASFDHVNLTRAWLPNANLSGSSLVSVNLTEAGLIRTDLSRARLTGAILTDAKQQDAIFIGADLRSADLAGMENLRPEQLAGALVDATTRLDAALSQHPWIQARIRECAGLPDDASAPSPTPDPGSGTP